MRVEEERWKKVQVEVKKTWTWNVDGEWWLLLAMEWMLLPLCAVVVWLYYIEAWTALGDGVVAVV